jgi:hypothetical protein
MIQAKKQLVAARPVAKVNTYVVTEMLILVVFVSLMRCWYTLTWLTYAMFLPVELVMYAVHLNNWEMLSSVLFCITPICHGLTLIHKPINIRQQATEHLNCTSPSLFSNLNWRIRHRRQSMTWFLYGSVYLIHEWWHTHFWTVRLQPFARLVFFSHGVFAQSYHCLEWASFCSE